MEIKNYTIAELEEWIEGDQYLNGDVVPISPVRVYSQKKNPHLHADDVVLTVARDENHVISGYIGALPFTLKGVKCAWNSCWWVREGAPAGVSMKLLYTFIQNWNQKVLFSEMTPYTVSIIEKLNFCKHVKTTGFRGYNRFILSEVLPRKKKTFTHFKFLLNAFDKIANVFVDLQGRIKKVKANNDHSFEIVDVLSPADDAFIKQVENEWTAPRTIEDFNWIAENPWVVPGNEADTDVKNRYYFSYAVTRFKQQWVRVFRGEKQVGLFNATIRDRHLKIPYVFCDEDATHLVSGWIMNKLKNDKKLCSVTTFHEGLSKYLRANERFLYSTNLPKFSAISTQLAANAGVFRLSFQMGDGDVIFT
ncbi:MAG: hypothetical protein K9G70_01615 [Prolixibacteraceae bacterium]|nr:hypothetical protein [Prolixibacteraceae bacterium]